MSSPGLPKLPPIPRGVPSELEKHVTAIKWLLGAYLVLLVIAWHLIINARSGPESTAKNLPFWVGAAVYCALIVECTIVQQGLFAARVGKHRGWQVVVGGVILNPCVFGWWIPVSVLLAVRRAR